MKQLKLCVVNCSDCMDALEQIMQSFPCFVQVLNYNHTKAYVQAHINCRTEDAPSISFHLQRWLVE